MTAGIPKGRSNVHSNGRSPRHSNGVPKGRLPVGMRALAAAAVLAATLLAAPIAAPVAQAQTKTLRFVPHADLKILDPTFTTAYISRNFGYMVYDTLFALDENGQPQPQMVDSYTTSADGKTWTFTLRPGLKFSDGSPVTAKDAVASIVRWATRDAYGPPLKAAGAAWSAVDERQFRLQLNEPFGLVLQALAKPSGFPPFVLPERLAAEPTSKPLTEVLGSGPYVFKRDEWVPGNKIVFVANPHYVARSEAPSALAGSKKPQIERVEWIYLPDANNSITALQQGEVDYVEQVPPDLVAPLRQDKRVAVFKSSPQQGQLVMNHLHPPFDNPKVRQALLKAVDQSRFMAATGYPEDMRMPYCATYFICGGPNDTSAGSEPFQKPDVAEAKKRLAEAGYKGEKVVLLITSDVPYLNALSLMTLQTMKSIGLNVEPVSMDWASIGSRRARRDAPTAGGWSAYATVANEFAVNSPITGTYLSAACGNTLPGWPCDEKLDRSRTAWLREADPARRKEALDAFQRQAFETARYLVLGQYFPAAAAVTSLKHADKVWSGIANLWVLDK